MAVPIKYNIRNLVVRKVSTTMTVFGFALVVGIFVVVMAMLDGLEATLVSTGSLNNIISISKGNDFEVTSMIMEPAETLQVISYIKGVKASPAGKPLVSPEYLASISVNFRDGGKKSMSIRGIEPIAFEVHDKVRIIEGRHNAPGMYEIIAGKSLSQEFKSFQVGSTISFSGYEWSIVGIFEASGSSFESEIWTDIDILKAAKKVKHITSVVLKVDNRDDMGEIAENINNETRVSLQATAESAYYAKQNEAAQKMKILGYVIAIIMAFGAIFGAMNTMYASISERIKEVGTLRAIGFSKRAILFSFVLECLVMGIVGGIIGCIFSLGVSGSSMSVTGSGRGVAALAFQFNVTISTMAIGLMFAVVMGILGGLLPAANAARLPIIRSLREI